MISDFIREEIWTEIQIHTWGEHHVNMKAVRMMYLQAKMLKTANKHQQLRKGMRQVLGHKQQESTITLCISLGLSASKN